MARQTNKAKRICSIILKHWKPTIGSLTILVSVFLLILKKIEVETLAAIVAAMLAAGYIPKAKDDVTE
jgi:ubiquitin-protein ligase